MRTIDLKMIILKMFGYMEFYGYEVHKKLISEDIKIEISRLYRILNEMLKEGLLEGRWEKSQLGPKKRVYQLGRKGREELDRILLDAIKTVHSFYGKYLMTLPSNVNPVDGICRLLTDEMKGMRNIGYVTPNFSPIHERMIHALHDKVPEGNIYLVKPRSVRVKMNLDNLLFLDGAYDNIPMKNGYFDILVVVDLPKEELLETVLKECHRVVSQKGRLGILTPTVLIHKYEDPLTIGEFVEKYEHEKIERGEHLDKGVLQALLEKYFKRVEERQIIHMSVCLAFEPRVLQH
ncbi:MAG: PadR family transcriptional regulator [Candidatus Bathyarchaeota archaeon]|jgi:DNA-binding PadR family transcriptional regulator|nr:PadR family transcriptional regulator [Candidatus Bathyarchaeota archaeon]